MEKVLYTIDIRYTLDYTVYNMEKKKYSIHTAFSMKNK